ncbi:conserved hypothetical protein (DUF208) [Alteracholeplasma palmae J233]|uniref:Epoxyqueuosine reductase QueH n=1 Tax=Alteracholeplasma palmae (strain ATCC 49389 / J233) TaxID=1318466 RepID=U4KLU3_ALTPJ|nr:epoxyqueuosine reductase QueH [Alteracholeplasma palmae]CCV64964.1 conserved hypothetical protein (DUF208) [Alteracholeplasma palmae J233]
MFEIDEILKKYNKDQKINYDQILLDVIKQWQKNNVKPKIILHSCCAPCSTYVLEEMTKYADITIYFSNSNIHPKEEYQKRALVQEEFIKKFNLENHTNVLYIEDEYQPQNFIKDVYSKKLEEEKEGGARCSFCFEMRLDRVAKKAVELGYDYFGSAITLSPHKNSQVINAIGFDVQKIYDVSYLPTDFKKRGGYKRSVELCNIYDIYRQCYCGCVFAALDQGIDLKETRREAIQFLEEFNKKKEV